RNIVPNFDRNGGMLLAKSRQVADEAEAARDKGEDPAAVVARFIRAWGAPDELIGTLMAQARDLSDPNHARQALWIPAADWGAMNARQARQLRSALGPSYVALENFDGQGGMLMAKSRAAADAVAAARRQGESPDSIVGRLTAVPLLAVSSQS